MKKWLSIVFLVSCVSTKPTVPKDIEQSFRMGCELMINQVAFVGGFTEEQYEWLIDVYERKCTLREEL